MSISVLVLWLSSSPPTTKSEWVRHFALYFPFPQIFPLLSNMHVLCYCPKPWCMSLNKNSFFILFVFLLFLLHVTGETIYIHWNCGIWWVKLRRWVFQMCVLLWMQLGHFLNIWLIQCWQKYLFWMILHYHNSRKLQNRFFYLSWNFCYGNSKFD